MYQITDIHADLRLLDDTRRFYFSREWLMSRTQERLGELKNERAVYLGKIEATLSKHQLDTEKAVERLRKRVFKIFVVQMTPELTELVRNVKFLVTLETVQAQYKTFLAALSDPSCVGTGTITGRHERDVIGITGTEYQSFTTPFDRARFEERLTAHDPEPESMMGVGTAVGYPGYGRAQQAVAPMGIEDAVLGDGEAPR